MNSTSESRSQNLKTEPFIVAFCFFPTQQESCENARVSIQTGRPRVLEHPWEMPIYPVVLETSTTQTATGKIHIICVDGFCWQNATEHLSAVGITSRGSIFVLWGVEFSNISICAELLLTLGGEGELLKNEEQFSVLSIIRHRNLGVHEPHSWFCISFLITFRVANCDTLQVNSRSGYNVLRVTSHQWYR